MNQISTGLIAEAMTQLKLSMGDLSEQKVALEAQANIKKTWQDLIDKAKVDDGDRPLVSGRDDKAEGLSDPSNPVVAVCNYIY